MIMVMMMKKKKKKMKKKKKKKKEPQILKLWNNDYKFATSNYQVYCSIKIIFSTNS
jgi:lysophospholipid acyltransferase (LPLAT)-like uncharacterized protein